MPSKKQPVEVNDEDARVFAHQMIKAGVDAKNAYTLALIREKHRQMTNEYAEKFAHKVRQIVEWAVPPEGPAVH